MGVGVRARVRVIVRARVRAWFGVGAGVRVRIRARARAWFGVGAMIGIRGRASVRVSDKSRDGARLELGSGLALGVFDGHKAQAVKLLVTGLFSPVCLQVCRERKRVRNAKSEKASCGGQPYRR